MIAPNVMSVTQVSRDTRVPEQTLIIGGIDFAMRGKQCLLIYPISSTGVGRTQAGDGDRDRQPEWGRMGLR